MYQTVSKHDFTEAFKTMGRGEQFSYKGLQALFDYLEDYEDDAEESELDVVAICCDYEEWDTAFDGAMEHGFTPDDADDKEEQEDEALEYLLDRTTVINVGGNSIIIQKF
jgi:hypothetical protein